MKVFPKKADQPFDMIIDQKVFGLDNVIENQYIHGLAEISKLAIANQVTAPTIKT